MQNNPYYKKTLGYKFHGRQFTFAVSQELFSSVSVDRGTELLLRTIAEAKYADVRSVLDIGCGYGVLGIATTALYPEAELTLVDRDKLAVDFSAYNLAMNKPQGAAYASLGFDSVEKQTFDLIVSNLPGKAGVGVLTDLLESARYYSHTKTIVAVVVVEPIADEIARFLASNDMTELLLRKDSKAYSVFHFRFSKSASTGEEYQPAMQRQVYDRSQMSDPRTGIVLGTVQGLPEFETLHYRTEMLAKVIQNDSLSVRGHAVSVWGPGQGFIPKLLSGYSPASLRVMSRDLLSLQVTKRNIGETEFVCDYLHISDPQIAGAKSVYINLHERENLDVIIAGLEEIEPRQKIYIAGTLSQIHKLRQYCKRDRTKIVIAELDEYRGFGCVRLSLNR